MKYVENFGGVFVYSKNPRKLAQWYKKNLGIDYKYTKKYKSYYLSFPYIEKKSGKKAYTVWGIFENKKRPAKLDKIFTVNYRIYDLEKLVKHLKKNKTDVTDIEVYPEGKFAWVHDADGNRLELWEDTKMK